jgi:hypothetical protein
MSTHYYERDVSGGTVRWEPDNESAAYEAIVKCAETAPETVSEAKTQCPIKIENDEHAAIRAQYADLVDTSDTTKSG